MLTNQLALSLQREKDAVAAVEGNMTRVHQAHLARIEREVNEPPQNTTPEIILRFEINYLCILYGKKCGRRC